MCIRLLRSIERKLDRVIGLLQIITHKETIMGQATDNLAAAVQRETSVVSSVTTLISGLAAQIKQASADPQVQALADQINANSDTLADAVTTNTPAAAQTAAGGGETTSSATN
jgi:cell pole-organizing protein PopZ